ncbi:MAG: hypothetical protein ABH843_02875 [Candidatus Omnitrophota bacterium]
MDFSKDDAININEKFLPIETKSIDFKNRINLGTKIIKLISRIFNRADAYQVFIGKEGDILLRPVVSIPSREAWVYKNPKVIKQIRQGLDEAAKGELEKIDNIDEFLKDL